MTDFDLNNFLKTYKQKVIDLKPYLRFSALKGFKILNDKNELSFHNVNGIYIKYIQMGNALINNKYTANVIEDGGELIAGGNFINGEFVESCNNDTWTHLKLKTGISKKTKSVGKKMYNYYIKISSHYIFYMKFLNG